VAGIPPWYVNFVLLKILPAMGSVRLDRFVVAIMRRVTAGRAIKTAIPQFPRKHRLVTIGPSDP
jgi:hypothetical protein